MHDTGELAKPTEIDQMEQFDSLMSLLGLPDLEQTAKNTSKTVTDRAIQTTLYTDGMKHAMDRLTKTAVCCVNLFPSNSGNIDQNSCLPHFKSDKEMGKTVKESQNNMRVYDLVETDAGSNVELDHGSYIEGKLMDLDYQKDLETAPALSASELYSKMKTESLANRERKTQMGKQSKGFQGPFPQTLMVKIPPSLVEKKKWYFLPSSTQESQASSKKTFPGSQRASVNTQEKRNVTSLTRATGSGLLPMQSSAANFDTDNTSSKCVTDDIKAKSITSTVGLSNYNTSTPVSVTKPSNSILESDIQMIPGNIQTNLDIGAIFEEETGGIALNPTMKEENIAQNTNTTEAGTLSCPSSQLSDVEMPTPTQEAYTYKDFITYTGLDRPQCNICRHRFATNYDLKTHMRQHSVSEPTTKCEICGKAYPSHKQMLAHMRVCKLGDAKTQCDICGKFISIKGGKLQKHKREVHGVGEQKFECDICQMRFFKKQRLVSHRFTHTGKKEFLCPHCGQEFLQQIGLNHHITYVCHVASREHREKAKAQYKKYGKTRKRKTKLTSDPPT